MLTNGTNTELRCLARDLDDLFDGDAWWKGHYHGTKIAAVAGVQRMRVKWWGESREIFHHNHCFLLSIAMADNLSSRYQCSTGSPKDGI